MSSTEPTAEAHIVLVASCEIQRDSTGCGEGPIHLGTVPKGARIR